MYLNQKLKPTIDDHMKEILKPLLTSLYILSQNFCKRPHQCKKGVTTLIVSRFLRGLKAVGFS